MRYILFVNGNLGEKPFFCEECDINFMYKKSLQSHMKSSHSDGNDEEVGRPKMYECDECEETFNRRDKFKWHKQRHAGVVPFECDECGKQFFRNDHLTRHKRMHSGKHLRSIISVKMWIYKYFSLQEKNPLAATYVECDFHRRLTLNRTN